MQLQISDCQEKRKSQTSDSRENGGTQARKVRTQRTTAARKTTNAATTTTTTTLATMMVKMKKMMMRMNV
jgi:hypothetical protein